MRGLAHHSREAATVGDEEPRRRSTLPLPGQRLRVAAIPAFALRATAWQAFALSSAFAENQVRVAELVPQVALLPCGIVGAIEVVRSAEDALEHH